MKTRTDLLNHLIEKNGLKRYLEIGVQVPELNFDKINCPYKIGVDPDPNAHATICKTSDEYFEVEKNINEQFPDLQKKYDLIFIDGLHTAEQVKKDFENALEILSPNGFIVLHDCNPEKEEHTIVPRPTKTGHWNGDVYKFAIRLKASPGVQVHTVNEDNGLMVVQKDKFPLYIWDSFSDDWNFFDSHRKELLNLISWDEFAKL